MSVSLVQALVCGTAVTVVSFICLVLLINVTWGTVWLCVGAGVFMFALVLVGNKCLDRREQER